MKKIMLVSALIAVTMMAVGAFAANSVKVRADVPFDFYAGKELVPAGVYVFEMRPSGLHSAVSSSVAIRNLDGKVMTVLFTMPASGRNVTQDQLQFHQYGDTYFLSTVESIGFRADLRTSSAEKEMRAQAEEVRNRTLLAQK